MIGVSLMVLPPYLRLLLPRLPVLLKLALSPLFYEESYTCSMWPVTEISGNLCRCQPLAFGEHLRSLRQFAWTSFVLLHPQPLVYSQCPLLELAHVLLWNEQTSWSFLMPSPCQLLAVGLPIGYGKLRQMWTDKLLSCTYPKLICTFLSTSFYLLVHGLSLSNARRCFLTLFFFKQTLL